MAELQVSTLVYLPPEAVYEFLIDFPRYADYSRHLESVARDGDGGPGTEYALRFAWWQVGYTVTSRVTAVDPPERIAFDIVRGIAASGTWTVEPAPDAAPPDGAASRVALSVAYDPDSVAADAVSLPRFVSLGWVVRRAQPYVEREARRIVERVVADLEGTPREVDLEVRVA